VAGVIVFDASVLIAYFDGDDDLHGEAESLLADVIDDDFGANSLTLAEVLAAPARTGRMEMVLAALGELELSELSFPDGTAVSLVRMRVGTGLKMPDCCVLLTAENQGATVASFNDRLVRAAEDRGLPVLRR
jgi:predicted nucleic acid-binding protein